MRLRGPQSARTGREGSGALRSCLDARTRTVRCGPKCWGRRMAGMEALAQVAALLADKTRAAFCGALLDGRAWTATELARHARVAPSTASEHLTRLIEGGVLVEHRQGRHRYVSLAGSHVAELLETMTAFAGPGASPRGLRA